VQLYEPKRIRQADAGAARPRGKKELEDFLLVRRRDSLSRVVYFDSREIAGAAQIDGDCAIRIREITGVQQKVQDRLMNDLPIDQYG
jgi:hypothetical protein